ncbi:hypothetical protein [Mesorhizobium sp.]|uniref:hypothetical protein n=1 Tax=Mesorhizobium sp. TaxID=1871066 RepID=UPI000FE78C3F|nr:hypothetical protein [Mesorhizobium sp.]RWP73798.1 MAG: hypothetical protein EOR09_17680 [Mesorhizobium sp.]RWP81810.1 MAG: hypothetical protein EOR10_04090 [Mesorhizobium sp.]
MADKLPMTLKDLQDQGYVPATQEELTEALGGEAFLHQFREPFDCTVADDGDVCLRTGCIGLGKEKYRYVSVCFQGQCKQTYKQLCP